MLLQQRLAGAHLANEEKRQWLESMQDAAAHRARFVGIIQSAAANALVLVSYARQLAAKDAELRSQVEAQANSHFEAVIKQEEANKERREKAQKAEQLAKFKADIAARRDGETQERDVSISI